MSRIGDVREANHCIHSLILTSVKITAQLGPSKADIQTLNPTVSHLEVFLTVP